MANRKPTPDYTSDDVDPRERATAVVMTIDWLSRVVGSPDKTPTQKASAARSLAMIVEQASRGLRGYFPAPRPEPSAPAVPTSAGEDPDEEPQEAAGATPDTGPKLLARAARQRRRAYPAIVR